MKKIIVLLCSFIVVICFSCKKTCYCELITVDNHTGDIIDKKFKGTYQIDRKSTCDILANDKTIEMNGNNAGTTLLVWFFVSAVRGEFVSMPDNTTTRSYYQCTQQ